MAACKTPHAVVYPFIQKIRVKHDATIVQPYPPSGIALVACSGGFSSFLTISSVVLSGLWLEEDISIASPWRDGSMLDVVMDSATVFVAILIVVDDSVNKPRPSQRMRTIY